MSLFEGIALGPEKQAVVMDIGHAYTKLGFAGEDAPRFIIPSEVQDIKSRKVKKVFSYDDQEELKANLVDFLQVVYFRYLLVTAKERRVVIIESLLNPTTERETLASVLYYQFEVPSLLFASVPLLCTMTLGAPSVLVVDIGHKEILAMPVYEGVTLLNCWEATPVGAKCLHDHIHQMIVEHGEVVTDAKTSLIRDRPEIAELLTNDVIEDIKVRCCFVTNFSRKQRRQSGEDVPYPPAVDYPLLGEAIIRIPGKIREEACEVMFEMDADCVSATTVILDSLLKSPVDCRKVLSENILLVGGGASLSGLAPRLQREANALLQDTKFRYADKLAIRSTRFHTAPCKPNYTAWLGGSLFGNPDVLNSRALTRDAFKQLCGRLPDWLSADQQPARQ